MPRSLADLFGRPVRTIKRVSEQLVQAGSTYVSLSKALEWHDKFMNPIVAPSDMIPPSVFEGGGFGRAYHLPLPRFKVPLSPEEGRICEDCANFRYEAGQEWVRTHGDPFRDAPKVMGARAPRAADLGLCAAKDGSVLVSRFHGSVVDRETVRCEDGSLAEAPVRDQDGNIVYKWLCSTWKDARSTFSTSDSRKDRSRSPLGPGNR